MEISYEYGNLVVDCLHPRSTLVKGRISCYGTIAWSFYELKKEKRAVADNL